MNENLIPNIRAYASARQLEIVEPLGSGKDGIVIVGKSKAIPARVAIKAHRHRELYTQEKVVYQRLRQMAVTTVVGFNVPTLIGFDDERWVLEMTIVRRPFVLDFAGAHLDKRPEFPADVWMDWESEKQEQFEERWPTVENVMSAFEELGIYLLDVSPGNIGFVA